MPKEWVRYPHDSMNIKDRKLLSWILKDTVTKKEFRHWFGKSVLKDRRNTPLILYHGTNMQFDKFDESKMSEMGFHFGSAHAAGRKSEEGGRIYPVVIKMENPMRLYDSAGYNENQKSFSLDKIKTQIAGNLVEKHCKPQDKICEDKITDEIFFKIKTETELKKYLKDFGYDGIIYLNQFEDRSDSVIVFDMKQVRSALDGRYLHK